MSCCHLMTSMSYHSTVKAERTNTLNKYGSGCQLYWDQTHHCVPLPSSTPSLKAHSSLPSHRLPHCYLCLSTSLDIGRRWGLKQLEQEGTWRHRVIFGADGGCEICPNGTECCRQQSRLSARERFGWSGEVGWDAGAEGKDRGLEPGARVDTRMWPRRGRKGWPVLGP